MQRSRKRQRTVPVVVQGIQRRPIDKRLINIQIGAQTAVQTNVSLITATYPATITGIRWSFIIQSQVGGAANNGGWVLIRVKDGVAPNTFSFSNAGTLITPEQEVIAYGRWAVNDADIATSNGPSCLNIEGHTKSMRKLMGGDQIYFMINGQTAGPQTVSGTVQFFAKT